MRPIHTHTHTHTLTHTQTLKVTEELLVNMSARVWTFILTLSALCGPSVVSGVLSGPTNVSLTSYNMDLVLRWDSPVGAESGLLYTAEYKSSISEFREGCVNDSSSYCDFTGLNFSIFEYGRYTARVRAQLGAETSDWVESNEITLDMDTTIGPPNVSLSSNGATIDVSITDPVFVVSTLRTAFAFVTYNITYWKDGQREKAKIMDNVQQSRVVLNDLDIRTKYCVQVQINVERNSQPGRPSRIVCASTKTKEEAPWVTAVVTFVIMAVAVALVVVTVVYWKSISHFLCPKDALPQHFKEYLLAPPNSYKHSSPTEEICHQVRIVADHKTVEEGRPLEAEGSSCSKEPDVAEVVER